MMGLASSAAPAQKFLLPLWHSGNVLLLPLSLPCSVMDTKICSGEVTARMLRGLWQILTLGTGTAASSPGHFQIPCGFCPDWLEPCQGRARWLTQTLQEATGKETSSTSSPAQPPTQLHPQRGLGRTHLPQCS